MSEVKSTLPGAFTQAYWNRISDALGAFDRGAGPPVLNLVPLAPPEIQIDAADMKQEVEIITLRFSKTVLCDRNGNRTTFLHIEPNTPRDRELINKDAQTVTDRAQRWMNVISAMERVP